MRLHRFADGVGNVRHALAAGGRVERCQPSNRRLAACCGKSFVALLSRLLGDDSIAGRASEHEKVQQRIGTEPVGAVNADARAFTDRIQPLDNSVRVAARGCGRDHLAVVIGRNATHLIMDRRHHRDRLADRIDVGKLDRNFANRRQPLHDRFGAKVIELQQYIILVRPAAPPFLDLLIHRT